MKHWCYDCIIPIILMFTTACAHHHRVVVIPPSVQPIVNNFINDGNIEISDLIIQFGKLPGDTYGRCDVATGQSPTITLNNEYWTSLDANSQEELLFHELGHCVLFRDHTSTTWSPNGFPIPESIMNPDLFSGDIYKAYHSHYVKELFKN